MTSALPHQLLDDGFAPTPCDVLVVGCGNLLRGDDGLGPVLVRELASRQARGLVPTGVRLVDGGTAGIDVAFGMRGARRVVLVDAARTGNEPGTLYRLPAEAVAQVPPLEGLHSHAVRWDHALAFADWLLGPQKPSDITVFLVEAASFGPGDPLSAPVETAMGALLGLLAAEFWPTPTVEITEMGYLHLPAEVAAEHFSADSCLVRRGEGVLELLPLRSSANGGLVLKQHNAAGDRSVLIAEAMGFDWTAGRYPWTWDRTRGRLIVTLTPEAADEQRVRRGDHGAPGAGTVGGLSGGDLDDGSRGATAGRLPDRVTGPADGGCGQTHGGTASPTAGGAA